MNVKMTLTDARQKAKEKLGENGWAIRDPIASNPTVRKEARRNTSEFVGVLKDRNSDNKTRRAVELALPYQQFLCNYYRYKIGVADEEFGFPAFTVYMHGDSFEKCFEKWDNLKENNDKEKQSTGNAEPDDDTAIPS